MVPRRERTATISDIARVAGVAKSTVSKALNGAIGISPETREKILRIAEELNYRPSIIAQSLKSKRTRAIGLVLPNIMNPFFLSILKGVEDAAIDNGYVVVFCESDNKKRKESTYFQIFEERWVDGVIFSGVDNDSEEERYIRSLHERGIPVVLIDREIEGYFTNAVMIDNKGAAFSATTYLLELGHKKIATIVGPQKIRIFAKRFEGYKLALEKYGVKLDPKLVVEEDLSVEGGSRAIQKLLSQGLTFTAVFAHNDLMAIGCMKELQRNGIAIPGDVSVVGFDDIPLALLVTPSLTTVAQPAYEMGVEAVSLIKKSIEGGGGMESKVILPTKLVLRESVAPPPLFT
ncbi:MAG: LacI family DNA-binding transcriptional regulator [Candidatus Caldatribacterium sp.]|nr:LacI family DNA-binding transcriptional regulator [Candidatus Caldatribacterium sp.]